MQIEDHITLRQNQWINNRANDSQNIVEIAQNGKTVQYCYWRCHTFVLYVYQQQSSEHFYTNKCRNYFKGRQNDRLKAINRLILVRMILWYTVKDNVC